MLLVTVSIAATGGAVAAQSSRVSGVEITPSKFERDLPARDFSIRILVVNHERGARRIALSIAGLGHDLDGTPRFLEPAPATEAITPSDDEFTLEAGQRQELVLEGAIPTGERAVYAAAIAEFEPLARRRAAVEVTSRVASLFLLRGPKPWREKVRVVDVGVLPAAKNRPLPLYAAIRNVGNVHVKPRGRIDISQNGRVLDTVRLTGETIIPRFARRLTGEWRPPRKLTGQVELHAIIRNPAAEGRGVIDFSRGEPDRPGAKITNLVASDEGGAHVELIVSNTGTTPLEPTVTLHASRGGFAAGSDSFEQDELLVGESRTVTWDPSLEQGTYLITAQATLGDKLLDEAVTGLRVESSNLLRWIALAALCVVVGFFAWYVYQRRKWQGAAGRQSSALR